MPVEIDLLPSSAQVDGKLLMILVNLRQGPEKGITCEIPKLLLRQYEYSDRIFVAREGDEIVGMVAGRRKITPRHEAPPKQELAIETLCYKTPEIKERLLRAIKGYIYIEPSPTGESPGIPPNYTSSEFEYPETEGDPKGLLLPEQENDSEGGPYTTNFRANKKTGPSAFFGNRVRVTVGGRRRRKTTRKLRRKVSRSRR